MNGYFVSQYGYRWVLIVAMAFLNGFIFVVFFANTKSVLLVGQILCGLSWGVFATLAPSYGTRSRLLLVPAQVKTLTWRTSQHLRSAQPTCEGILLPT